MAQPVFRNPDKYQVLRWRDWGRVHLPEPKKGMVMEDLDLVLLLFSSLVQRAYSADGKFMLVEIKEAYGELDYAQERLFGLMHRLFRKADPERKFYIGFYVVRWGKEKPESINGARLTESEFVEFFTGKKALPSMFDRKQATSAGAIGEIPIDR